MAMNVTSVLNKIKAIPVHFQIIIAALPALILIALFVFLFYMPRNTEAKSIEAKLVKLTADIETSEAKIRKLDALIEENAMLTKKLAKLKEQLPEEKEVSVLLKQISELGLQSGLEILLWKPEARKTDAAGLYVEIPVNVEVRAEYHKLGDFFSHISRLPRLVNISDIALVVKDKGGSKDRGVINADFTALTFASAGPKDEAAGQEAVKK